MSRTRQFAWVASVVGPVVLFDIASRMPSPHR
jgi:hypothetical protein